MFKRCNLTAQLFWSGHGLVSDWSRTGHGLVLPVYNKFQNSLTSAFDIVAVSLQVHCYLQKKQSDCV